MIIKPGDMIIQRRGIGQPMTDAFIYAAEVIAIHPHSKIYCYVLYSKGWRQYELHDSIFDDTRFYQPVTKLERIIWGNRP